MEHYLSSLPIRVYIHDYEVDLGLLEHHAFGKEYDFQRSFDTFLSQLLGVIKSRSGHFQTVINKSPFQAAFDEDKNLLITRFERRNSVTNDELYELWTLLLKGPVTRRKLPGAARDSAYYIFPILMFLPYIRPIKIGLKDDTEAIAVELIEEDSQTQILIDQSEFEWA